MMVSRVVGFLGSIVLGTSVSSTQILAEGTDPTSAERAILVLDASGSMWGQIEGTPKIAIARDVIRGLLDDWSDDVELGLTAYGHREKGNCADIETLAPVGPLDAPAIMSAIGGLNPKGKTPLTAAVQQAAEALKYTEDKATVILVSDGEETCDLDPCEIGKALESTGVDFTAHIISFDVPEEETAGLRCLASETGGVFLEARNADELKDAMSVAKEIVTEEPLTELGNASVAAPDQVLAGSAFEVEWEGPRNEFDHIGMFEEDGDKALSSAYVHHNGAVSPAELTAPEELGTYEIRYFTFRKNTLARQAIEVVATSASVAAPDTVAVGSTFEVEWTGPQNQFDHIGMFKTDEDDAISRAYVHSDSAASPAELTAPEELGTYEIRYFTFGENTLARDVIEVVATSASVAAPDTVAAGSTFEVEWTGPQNQFDHIGIFGEDEDDAISRAYVHSDSAASPAELTAPEELGTYEIRYFTFGENTLARQTLTVK